VGDASPARLASSKQFGVQYNSPAFPWFGIDCSPGIFSASVESTEIIFATPAVLPIPTPAAKFRPRIRRRTSRRSKAGAILSDFDEDRRQYRTQLALNVWKNILRVVCGFGYAA
jgi:hypothetical protein